MLPLLVSVLQPPAAARAQDPADTGLRSGIVASAHPLATAAGLDVLRAGGNAVDAAVATAFAVGVVEPMMAGIGGSGSMLVWNQAEGQADYLDFYARAPARLPPEGSIQRVEHPAQLVAVPGAVAGLLEAHERFGRLDRATVMEPAVRLAEEGFPVSGLLARLIAADSARLSGSPRPSELFWPDGRALTAGEMLIQPELAATLRRIVRDGRSGFHAGPVASEIVGLLRAGGNTMDVADLAGFQPVWRRPLCGVYRGRVVLSAPPPQSGIQVIQALRLLDGHELAAVGPPMRSATAAALLADALRTAAADRRRYNADPDFASVPAAGLVSAGYAAERRAALASRLPYRVAPGDPWPFDAAEPEPACAALDAWRGSPDGPPPPLAPGTGGPAATEVDDGDEVDEGETTHLAVVDAAGNAVSLTFTQGVYFGSGMWAAGTFLNSGMNLFLASRTGPNPPEPGRAPVSSIAPTLVLENGRVRLLAGSPGGGRIPPAIVQAIVYTLDYGLAPGDALLMPRIHADPSAPRIEFEQGFRGEVLAALHRRGFRMEAMPPFSLYFGGVQLIEYRDGRWVGAADPRRDGDVAHD